MYVRMMEKALSPGMQHADHASLGAEVLGIGADGAHRLGRRLEQDVVDDGLVLKGDRGDWRRHGEHDMEVWDRQQLRLPVGEPLRPSQALAFGAMPVPAAIVGDADLAAVGTPLGMAAEHRRAASLDSAHDATLPVGQGRGVLGAIGGAVAAEDIRHLERGLHGECSAGRRYREAEAIQRAGGVGDQVCGDLGVACRGGQPGVAQQHLDDADVGADLEQVGVKLSGMKASTDVATRSRCHPRAYRRTAS